MLSFLRFQMGTSTHCSHADAFRKLIVPIALITQKIYFVRSARVMLDVDLARLYGVATKNLNKAVKRNMRRFPQDFMFQLSPNETRNLRFQMGTSRKGPGGRRASERRDHADLRAASRDAGNPRGVAPKNRRAGEALRREISGCFRNYSADDFDILIWPHSIL